MISVKKCTAFCVACCLALGASTSVNAADTENGLKTWYDVAVYDAGIAPMDGDFKLIGNDEYEASEQVSDIGTVSVRQNLIINKVGLPLFPVFDDTASALRNVASECKTVLDEIAARYGLSEMSEDNWRTYQEKMWSYLSLDDKADWYSEDNKEFVELDSFFDIYENSSKNDNIIEMAKEAKSVDDLLTFSDFSSSLSWKFRDSFCESIALTAGESMEKYDDHPQVYAYSTTDAVDYAKKYAVNYNTFYSYIKEADCTNFTSQIMCAGGKSVNTTWGAINTFGFWHYTSAWANANAFVDYWELDYLYSSHNAFANNLKKGDYITEDKENDGDWDHMGFVVDTGSSSATLGYRDYKVAQHTSDYLAWASSSTCGWDTLKSNHPKTIFGIVRL